MTVDKKAQLIGFVLRISLIFAGMATFVAAFAQKQSAGEPFIIQGRLINSPERTLKIFFESDSGREYQIETLNLDEQGNFYLKTWGVKYPQRTSIQQNRTQINDIYIAPGYDLTITGDATDFRTLVKTLAITGQGAAANQYKITRAATYIALNDTTQYWMLDPEALAAYAKKQRALNDSLASAVFTKDPVDDPYFAYFANMVRLDNQFMEAYYLLEAVNRAPMGFEESMDFAKKHIDNELLANFSQDAYLISQDYKNWALDQYVTYRRYLDARKDSSLVKEKGHAIRKINEVLSGRVKDYYLNATVTSRIPYTKTIEELNGAKASLKPFIQSIASEAYKTAIQQLIADKEQELLQTQTGKPAPAFTLKSAEGTVYNLSDFKGKVVYIDLWASWCVPCRQETPSFKQLYEKYKDDERVEFVSVAVSDGEKEWRKALEEDQPHWLQLYDEDGKVNQAYVANAIPKFIVVDKQGNIVDFNAPAPSSGNVLETLLLEEMAK
ncbi:Thiol-disulfide isomerase or thioredoxin [Parapedobacter koreensis]|uniref:Thiol-disulfide isomerase or thioredoxin n=2 Tax=Parapedobacter koreensis TaxID=332977 RepID=A0A1H7J0N1_9SPHI|nr:Thiol-disulfide isomerase or thioredoxin [Parapedobacter koreensis]